MTIDLGVAQRAPGPVDEHLEVGSGVGGQPVGPQRLGEHLVRDQVGAAHGEHPQQRAHLAAPEGGGRHLGTVAVDLEAAQQLQVHAHALIVLGC